MAQKKVYDDTVNINMIISERIQMLLKPMNTTNADEKKYVSQLINQAEVILKHLPDADQDTLNI